ncbi:Putative LOC100679567, partial [Caligus rogercresseyi]
MEVEVGGWPIPDVYWYKNDQMITPRIVTENYNHLFNAYVPEKKIEMAVCEADIEIEESEDSYTNEELFLPKLWRTGKRLTWKDEDERAKKFVGSQDPELSEEDIRDMTKRVSGTPLPRALEYLASLPDYKPDRTPSKTLPPSHRLRQRAVRILPIKSGSPPNLHQEDHSSRLQMRRWGKGISHWRSSQAQAKRKELRYNNVKCPSNVGNKEPSKRYPKDIKDLLALMCG